MATRQKLPPGLFRRRRRDGTELPELWCYYYVRGRAQPVKERTGADDVEEAKRFLYARKAEHPTARAQRLTRQTITTADALVLYERDAEDHRRPVQRGQVLALKHAIGAVPLAELSCACLDSLCRMWRTVGVEYPERDDKLHPLRPVTGATCNRMMALLRRARTLAVDKLSVELPRLKFPRFHEEPAGGYVAPDNFYSILSHVDHPTKRAFFELLYLLGIRPGQLISTETSNVRVERGQVVALVYRPAQVKQRTPHDVPLVGRAQEVVQDLWRNRRLGCKRLFHIGGTPLGQVRSEWRRACEAAGVVAGRKAGGVVPYNLRHSCLTNLAAREYPTRLPAPSRDTRPTPRTGATSSPSHRRRLRRSPP